MIPAAFNYVRPRTLEEALQLLVQHGEAGKLLAGGHSLGDCLLVAQTVFQRIGQGFLIGLILRGNLRDRALIDRLRRKTRGIDKAQRILKGELVGIERLPGSITTIGQHGQHDHRDQQQLQNALGPG